MITIVRSVKAVGPRRRRPRWSADTAAFGARIFRLRPRVEWMEDRTLLSTFVVSNTQDSGAGLVATGHPRLERLGRRDRYD